MSKKASLSLACSIQYTCAVVLFNWCWSVCGGRWLTWCDRCSMLRFSLTLRLLHCTQCSLAFKVVVLMSLVCVCEDDIIVCLKRMCVILREGY
jgi:hypothetical protein